jgi:hypothetical protein
MDAGVGFIANVAILSKELAKESWFNTFWAPFSGNVDLSTLPNGNQIKRPSGKPIEILDSFIEDGRDNMLIPFLKRLTGAPVYGDTVVKGTGEQQVLWWLRSYINQYRKAVEAKSGAMSYQRQKIYRLMEAAKPQLVEWLAQYENQECSRAYYEGVSKNLSSAVSYDGLGLYKRYHPNFFYNVGNVLTEAGTAGKTKIASDLDSAVAATDEELNTTIMRQLKIKAMNLKIPQMVTRNGYKYWVMLAHPTQTDMLLADTDYQASSRESYSGLKDNDEMKGLVAYWQGFAIFEDIVAVRAWDNAAGGFFGDDDTSPIASEFDPTAITDNICAIVFGNQSMGKGVAEAPNFTTEEDDHKNIKEIAFNTQNGYNRAEFVAESDASESAGVFTKGGAAAVASATTATNQSSLILMTTQS